ncbi:glycosyltransferase [Streptomyces lunaelactis]|uniref:glycosyltransferase n=1 Tax=Streptomyces lunaelactis TaxID=1535768 RepID=UPI0015859DC1|nr:glycosyltransferase [Streptomyces lunaelactis]NUK03912.1 glycosyltransferase [Streptomyces lunaelactis]NUK17922.1 glycosyltransferase [Streptomyces lunaelactis]NUK25802.1 glycosyltransferase [Streptomyces lunaelactis]NUK52832.1 glycosyltransferase [Streptomyces lunaelactis]NUK63454.1 glycosyltransferase [Streptomyces lunaelactis]
MATSGHPPRVLLLTSGPVDGQQGADSQLAAAVAHAIPDVEFTWFRRWPGRGGPPPVARGRPVPVVSLDGIPHVQQRLQVATASAVLAHRVDLVHAVMTIADGYPAFSRLWPRLVGRRPVLHTVPGVRDPSLLRRARPLGRTVALSASTAKELSAAGFGQVLVIPPLVRLDQWPMRPRPVGEIPMVLVTAHHDPGGGASEAIAAAAVAARAGARFRLVLAMRGRPRQNLRALEDGLRAHAEREGLCDVDVRGYVEDMSALLAESDVLLFVPQLLDVRADVPLTVLQSLATGRPVIVSDQAQFAALGDTVLRVPIGDFRRTGHLLRQLLDRPQWWEILAKRGRATVEERFGPEPFRAHYTNLYRELLA